VRRVLGETISPAARRPFRSWPKGRGRNPGELTLPQVLARHREQQELRRPATRRFDSIGLVFEDFGPIGERRAEGTWAGSAGQNRRDHSPDGNRPKMGRGGPPHVPARTKRQDDFVDKPVPQS